VSKKNSLQVAVLLLSVHCTVMSMHTTKSLRIVLSPQSNRNMCVSQQGKSEKPVSDSFVVDSLFLLTKRVAKLEKTQRMQDSAANKIDDNCALKVAKIEAMCRVYEAKLPNWDRVSMISAVEYEFRTIE
jgi:hypothetical protein